MIYFKKINPMYLHFGLICIILFFGYSLIAFSTDISLAIINSISTCLNIIVPALFGFLVLSGFLVKTNIYIMLSKPFGFISRYVFKIQPRFFSVFLISIFAGFPIGAKLLRDLLDSGKISQNEAARMLNFCYTAGPSFIIGLVGIQIFSSIKVGLLIYLSVVLTNIFIGIFIGLFKKVPCKEKSAEKIHISVQDLISSIESGGKSILLISVLIVFFSIVTIILDKLGAIRSIALFFGILFKTSCETNEVFVKSILEISNLSLLPKNCYSLIPFISSIFSFGGFCIILQIIGIIGEKIKIGKFILIRLGSMVVCFAIASIIVKHTNFDLIVSSNISQVSPAFNMPSSPITSILLLIMTILLISKKN